jgi:molybdopterin molybdotransferase
MDLSFWKVAVRPGRPLMHGRLGGMHVLGLPGNPVSSYVCAFLFLVPLIRRMSGRADLTMPTVSAVLGADLPKNDERVDCLLATLRLGVEGDCLIIREPYAPAAPARSRCAIVKFER